MLNDGVTITTKRIETPEGFRYIGLATPLNHPAIVEVGTGWCLTPEVAEAEARWHYALAVQAYENVMQARKEARAA